MRLIPPVVFGILIFSSFCLFGQAGSEAGKNLIANGGFESVTKRENLWDGVDNGGYFAGERGAVPVLTQSGAISDVSMPISVSIADMNGDRLPDVVTMDVLGYLRIFFNSGDAANPKFTVGEMGGIFLTRTKESDPLIGGVTDLAEHARRAPRLCATESAKTGKKDLFVGNYAGEVFLVPNVGSAQAPAFRQPIDLAQITVPTSKDPSQKWGNVFAPAVWDWNKDGREDLLLGEGSYSANNIHLLINQGSGARPVFDETKRYPIAFGDGLEQLTPTVVDCNADGLPDLLVSERSGKIAVYLNNGGKSDAGGAPAEITFSSFISGPGGGVLNFGGICTVSTGDFNGDGLFDLCVGKANGRVALLLNVGTKAEPHFAAASEMKGESGTPTLALPTGWDVNFGLTRGNFYGFFDVVSSEQDKEASPSEGTKVLKAGYFPSPNKVMPSPSTFTQLFGDWTPTGGDPGRRLHNAPARFFNFRLDKKVKLRPNANYSLTFKTKGRYTDGFLFIDWRVEKKMSEARVIQGERGSAKVQKNNAWDEGSDTMKFTPGAAWTEVRKDFKAVIDNKDLQDVTTITDTDFNFSFVIHEGGVAYFDDFKLIEKP